MVYTTTHRVPLLCLLKLGTLAGLKFFFFDNQIIFFINPDYYYYVYILFFFHMYT